MNSELFSVLQIVIGSLVVPAVVSLVKLPTFPVVMKRLLALVVSAAAAVLEYMSQNDWGFDLAAIIACFAVIYTLAQVTYKGIWEDTAPEAFLERVGS